MTTAIFSIRNITSTGKTSLSAEVWLAQAAAVASYQVELVVSGLPAGLGFTVAYTGDTIFGLNIAGGLALGGFANSDAGVNFDAQGMRLGTVVFGFDAPLSSAVQLDVGFWELQAIDGTEMLAEHAAAPFDFGATSQYRAQLGTTHWKSGKALPWVQFAAGDQSGTTDAAGTSELHFAAAPPTTLTASRSVPSGEANATKAAINLSDAIAILKLIVGLPVNGAGVATSPYQYLAADFDQSGTVGLQDAIGVLKHVVGLPAPAPGWRLIDATDVGAAALKTLSPGALPVIDLQWPTATVQVNLVGLLSGDVDGSFVPG